MVGILIYGLIHETFKHQSMRIHTDVFAGHDGAPRSVKLRADLVA